MEMEVGRCLSQAGVQSVGRNAFSHMCMAIAASRAASCALLAAPLWREARILSALCPEYSNQIPPRRPHAAHPPSSVPPPRSSLALVELLLGGLFKAARNCRPRSVMPSKRGCWHGLALPRWCSEAYGMALTWPAIRDRAPSTPSTPPPHSSSSSLSLEKGDWTQARPTTCGEQSRAGRKEGT